MISHLFLFLLLSARLLTTATDLPTSTTFATTADPAKLNLEKILQLNPDVVNPIDAVVNICSDGLFDVAMLHPTQANLMLLFKDMNFYILNTTRNLKVEDAGIIDSLHFPNYPIGAHTGFTIHDTHSFLNNKSFLIRKNNLYMFSDRVLGVFKITQKSSWIRYRPALTGVIKSYNDSLVTLLGREGSAIGNPLFSLESLQMLSLQFFDPRNPDFLSPETQYSSSWLFNYIRHAVQLPDQRWFLLLQSGQTGYYCVVDRIDAQDCEDRKVMDLFPCPKIQQLAQNMLVLKTLEKFDLTRDKLLFIVRGILNAAALSGTIMLVGAYYLLLDISEYRDRKLAIYREVPRVSRSP